MARLLLPSDVTGLPAAALFAGVGISAVAAAALAASEIRAGLLKSYLRSKSFGI